jgi:hypothetical protein
MMLRKATFIVFIQIVTDSLLASEVAWAQCFFC